MIGCLLLLLVVSTHTHRASIQTLAVKDTLKNLIGPINSRYNLSTCSVRRGMEDNKSKGKDGEFKHGLPLLF